MLDHTPVQKMVFILRHPLTTFRLPWLMQAEEGATGGPGGLNGPLLSFDDPVRGALLL